MYEAGSTHPLPAAVGRGALREPTDFHRAVRIVAGNLFEDVEECERERLACMGRVCGSDRCVFAGRYRGHGR